MNIKTLRERLYETKLMSLIKSKKKIEEKINECYKLKNLLFDISFVMIAVTISGAIVYMLDPNPDNISQKTTNAIIITELMVLSVFSALMALKNKYAEKRNKENLGFNKIEEEIDKEFSEINTQKTIINYINGLSITYTNNSNINTHKNHIHNALMNKDYKYVISSLERILLEHSEEEKNEFTHDAQREKIAQYEKEIGVEITTNQTLNPKESNPKEKEMEKGWTNIL